MDTLPQWISVKEQKPPVGKRVVLLSLHRNGRYSVTKGRFLGRAYESEDARMIGYPVTAVKYWMYEQNWLKWLDNK